jgi:ABC-type sugar transport systems, permease components
MYLFSKWWIKLIFILPVLLVFTAFTFYPILDSFRASVYGQTSFDSMNFVGLDNFREIFQDKDFLRSLFNNFLILVTELVILLPFGLLLGIYLNTAFKGSELVKLLIFTPYILSGIMTGLVWFFVLDPGVGVLNSFLDKIGLHNLALEWIGGTTLTPFSVAVVDSWKSIGFYAVLSMAGIKMLPKDVFEAAIIDGTTPIQKLLFVTLPLLKETMKIITVLVVINALNTFPTVFMLTNGGPSNTSHVMATYIYRLQFVRVGSFEMALSSAMSVVMFVIVLGISIVFLSLTQKRVEE